MENLELVNQTIAKNLIYYRKAAGMTQAEVAAKINYSDKSVSKWESGNGVPDIYILMQLAALFDVTVNDIIGTTEKKPVENKRKRNVLHILIMLLSSGIVWLVATFMFVTSNLVAPNNPWWLCFLFALPVNAIILIVFSGIWKYKLLNFLSVSGLIWTLILAIYVLLRTVTGEIGNYWLLFLLGIPLQALETLWAYFRYSWKKFKESSLAFLHLKGRKKLRKADGTDETQTEEEKSEE